ncbi:unnamed protein product [Symbiodinium sp. CCMP2592]|nr:unnamed protein product [Symbiodinium sp. CCMP2592]
MACPSAEQPQLVDSGDENPVFTHLVSRVASMEPVDASILRATPASQVLQSCGAALRWTDQNLYERSFPVELIQVFWSHSWHGNHYMKRLLLLLLYNGPAAAIAATISALLVMTIGEEQGMTLVFGPWCTLTAGLVFVVVLLLWKPRTLVFLDQACINQRHAEQKAKGIISIGAFLKYSEQFLLIWDVALQTNPLEALLKDRTRRRRKVSALQFSYWLKRSFFTDGGCDFSWTTKLSLAGCLAVRPWKRVAKAVRWLQVAWVPAHNKQASWTPPSGWIDADACRALNRRADAAAGSALQPCSQAVAHAARAADERFEWARDAVAAQRAATQDWHDRFVNMIRQQRRQSA